MSPKAHRDRGFARRDHYAEVTDRVIAALEAGTPPWRRPWDPDKAGGPSMPRNAITGARYRGINVITLGMSSLAFSSGDPRWATYKQAADRGWQVKKGERGTIAYFFKRLEVRDSKAGDGNEDATKRIPCCAPSRCFTPARSRAFPSSCHRASRKRRGARRTPSTPSSPTAAPSCGSAAIVRTIHRSRITSRCHHPRHFIPHRDGAASSYMSFRTGRAGRSVSIAIFATASAR